MNSYSKRFLYFICAVSAMGGLLFGYDWVVIGGAKPFYELYFGISQSPVMQGVAMTTALTGCLVGAMVAGAAADKYGRKPLLTTAAVLFTVSAIATKHYEEAIRLLIVSQPDLLIWDDSLDTKNRIHCLYMLALGYRGLGDKERSERYLAQVEELDINHYGTQELHSLIV